MKPIIIPAEYNYIAAFLTLACNLKCSYCINQHGTGPGLRARRLLSGEEWVIGLNRIVSRVGLPVTLQGGEPSLHRDFIHILNFIKPELEIDILTNLRFDIDEFIKYVPPERLRRYAPYASIRVSYHPNEMSFELLVDKVQALLRAGYSVGVYGVMHPPQERKMFVTKKWCEAHGIDFRVKEFLGEHDGKIYGTYKYESACDGKTKKTVMCKTTELIIGSDGGVYRCHSDLYNGRPAIGNILDEDFEIKDIYRPCDFFGTCNPCDVKVKTDRYQKYGHTSVDIKFKENL